MLANSRRRLSASKKGKKEAAQLSLLKNESQRGEADATGNELSEKGQETQSEELSNKWNASKLKQLRKEIDAIDHELSALLLRRLEIASILGNLKQELGIPVKDAARENLVLGGVRARLTSSSLSENVQRIYLAILNEACKVQDDLS